MIALGILALVYLGLWLYLSKYEVIMFDLLGDKRKLIFVFAKSWFRIHIEVK